MTTTATIHADESMYAPMAAVVDLRASGYLWLSALFNGPPSAELIHLPGEPAFAAVVGEVAGDGLAAELAAASGADLDELRWEYNALFRVPGGVYLTPYESVYRGRRVVEGKECLGLLNGPETVAVLRDYRSLGVELEPGQQTLPDFAGAEIDFLRLLTRREQEAWGRDDAVAAADLLARQRCFLLDHVCTWLPELCARLGERTTQPFYAAASRFARAFLALEEVTFRVLPVVADEG